MGDERQRAALLAFVPDNIQTGQDRYEQSGGLNLGRLLTKGLGNMAWVVRGYERTEAIVQRHAEVTGAVGPSIDLRGKLLNGAIDGSVKFRELRVLVSVYSQLAGKRARYRGISVESQMVPISAGCRNLDALDHLIAAGEPPVCGLLSESQIRRTLASLEKGRGNWFVRHYDGRRQYYALLNKVKSKEELRAILIQSKTKKEEHSNGHEIDGLEVRVAVEEQKALREEKRAAMRARLAAAKGRKDAATGRNKVAMTTQ